MGGREPNIFLNLPVLHHTVIELHILK